MEASNHFLKESQQHFVTPPSVNSCKYRRDSAKLSLLYILIIIFTLFATVFAAIFAVCRKKGQLSQLADGFFRRIFGTCRFSSYLCIVKRTKQQY